MAPSVIAIINDDITFLNLMHDLLSGEGYETIRWLASDRAHQMLQRERPALALLDVRMEEPDAGLRLLREIRDDRITAYLPVIVCSADRRFLQEHAETLRDLRCAVLEKPFNLDELLEKISAMLDAPSEACG